MLKEIEALETSLALDAVTPEILLELGTSIARKPSTRICRSGLKSASASFVPSALLPEM